MIMACRNSIILMITLGLKFVIANDRSMSESDCPFSCECEDLERKVTCEFNDYVTRLPKLPSETNYSLVHGGNFGRFTGPSTQDEAQSCGTYGAVMRLELVNNGITSIADDAFGCMPELKELIIDGNKLKYLPSAIFRRTPTLMRISLPDNQLSRDVFTSICTGKNLEMIELTSNKMTIELVDLVCLGSLDNLMYVGLSGNIISGQIKDVLQPLRRLKSLVVQNCNITVLQNDAFAGFLQLETLDLSHNKIRHIPYNVLTNMANLKMLKLIGVGIFSTREWLSLLLNIEGLHLENNPLTELPLFGNSIVGIFLGSGYFRNLAKGSFSNLPRLEQINLVNCRISHVERGAFQNLPNLKIINLDGNNITEVSLSNLLSDLIHSPLQSLYLARNPLKDLRNESFAVFKPNKLIELYLFEANINRIMPNTFENFGELQMLDLSRNRLEKLDRNAFRGLHNLATLLLDSNSIQNLGQNTFQSLTNLRSLILSYNQLKSFDATFTGLSNIPLQSLYLNNNLITQVSLQDISIVAIELFANRLDFISKRGFKNITTLKYLGLASNIIRNLQAGALLSDNNLARLDLSLNDLGMWTDLPGFLGQMSSLTSLNLRRSLLGYLPQDQQIAVWSSSQILNKLQISDCQITSLFPGMFSGLFELTNLDASSNLIPSVEPLAFQNLTKLTTLILNRNLITFVNWESFLHLPNLQLLSLAYNPLVCTCQVLWTLQAIRHPNGVLLLQQDSMLCQAPLDVQNVKLNELSLTVLQCENHWVIMGKYIAVGVAILSAMILLYVIWHYRWHLRYTLFLARAGRGRYEELQDGREYTYDAFVAYSSKDLSWVEHQLMPNVDADYLGEEGYKLCISDRDWLAGVDIADNVVKSIVESRRTIIVLSKDFATSEWCQFELAMAQLKLNSDGKKGDRILVILLDVIPAELLTPRIIYFLSSKTYLAWSPDHRRQQMFWKSLHKSLRKELLYNIHQQRM